MDTSSTPGMTIPEAAQTLGVSVKTVRRRAHGRWDELGCYKVGGTWYLPPSALEQLGKTTIRDDQPNHGHHVQDRVSALQVELARVTAQAEERERTIEILRSQLTTANATIEGLTTQVGQVVSTSAASTAMLASHTASQAVSQNEHLQQPSGPPQGPQQPSSEPQGQSWFSRFLRRP